MQAKFKENMHNLFIDTNVYLGFYLNLKNPSATLTTLLKLMKDKEIQIFLPDQVRDEFERNLMMVAGQYVRELDKYISTLKAISTPPLLSNWENQKKFIAERDKYCTLCADLKKEYIKCITDPKNIINASISDVFKLAEVISEADEILARAQNRRLKGNPPGKKGDYYGDAIIWESLLSNTPDKQPLNFVTHDKDWANHLDENEFSPFLSSEWTTKKQAKIIYYQTLGELINKVTRRETVSKNEIEAEKKSSSRSSSGSGWSTGSSGWTGPVYSSSSSSSWTPTMATGPISAQSGWFISNDNGPSWTSSFMKLCVKCSSPYYPILSDDGRCDKCRGAINL